MASPSNITTKQVIIGNRKFSITSDDDYFAEIGSNFEPDMCNFFSLLLRPHFNVVDVGANIGCTTLFFSEFASSVKSFEPSPSTFKFLQNNVNGARLTNIEINNFGLGSVNEELTLTFAPNNRAGGFVSNLTQASAGHTIEQIQIRKGDDLLFNQTIHFLKIDVEGFEQNVINGLKNVIESNKPIVVLELNHWCLNAFQRTSVPDFFDFLAETFPILYAIDPSGIANLRDPSERYSVMYHHITQLKYSNIVGAFEAPQVERLLAWKPTLSLKQKLRASVKRQLVRLKALK
jgi:FkbM family methyltransferase